MLVRAIDRADVTVGRMAFHADLLVRTGFGRDVNRTIEVAEHSVVQLFHTVDFGLEVSRRAGTDMTIDTRHLRVRRVLGRHKLWLHWHMTTLTAKVHRLGVLIRFVTTKGGQKEKADGAKREYRQNPPIPFAGQIDLKNTLFLFAIRCTTFRKHLQNCAEKCECESKDKEKRRDDIPQDTDVGIFCRSEKIDGEK